MFERILTKEDFEKVYPILAQSFPETEVRAKEDQLALIENEKYHLYAIEDEDGTVGGVIAAWELADDFLYIEHFATLPEKRNHGFGGKMLDLFLRLQNEDGSFPRKFHEDLSIVDKSGGSTSSATLPLVMGYKYYGDKRYLEAAMRTADYMEQNIILKSDYFSSTLDANCEDKEASLYASVANYYLALVTRGEKSEHYARLCRDAAYFALSWYYLWDVPFAKGQMLGDLGLQTRGWGNVSVENNHIDVFIFGFADVLTWLSKRFDEPRFFSMANVISTSMRQLLPFEGHLCGVAKPGYYPEVIQHTYWDYGRNGKGFYNDIFAPGWTVASLWELYSPGRAERFFHK